MSPPGSSHVSSVNSSDSHLPPPSPSRLVPLSDAADAPLLEHSVLIPEIVDHNATPALAYDNLEAEVEPTRRNGNFGAEDRERLLRGYVEYGEEEDGFLEGVNGREEAEVSLGAEDGPLKSGAARGIGASFWRPIRIGVRRSRSIYLPSYLPFLTWTSQYKWSYLRGDFVAALTMASFYFPMTLSYAENLAHMPAINGLYSFVFNPFIYALLGSCPQMVVGPEAAGSLLLGHVVKSSVQGGLSEEDDIILHAMIGGLVATMAGAMIFIAGVARLGFLDGILSRPFLRGFISAIGFVILVDQLIPEMGLVGRAREVGHIIHGSSIDKLIFLAENIRYANGLTCAVAFGSFAIILALREIKKRLQPRYPSLAYFPDRFLVVLLSAILSWRFRWDQRGLKILGKVESSTGSLLTFHWPFQRPLLAHLREAMGTSFLIALLGFFESSVAGKSFSGGKSKPGKGIQGMTFSANRELIALGSANLVGGLFMALPAFGGYGRSKLNVSTGGQTPMSSILLSVLSLVCILFLLPYFYYLPKAVLSAMISAVAYSLIEEAPHDIKFFIKIRGWSELLMMVLIFAATILYSLPLGITLGVGLSVLSVIRHATKPRIQILGKVPETGEYENAVRGSHGLEFVEGCLIVKIPEPLTFANTGDLKTRLRRLELYGSATTRSERARLRSAKHNQTIVFDIHGVTELDGSGAQVLTEIVDDYIERGVRIFFCRVPQADSPVYRLFEKSGIIDKCGGERHFVQSVEEALRKTELANTTSFYRDDAQQNDA